MPMRSDRENIPPEGGLARIRQNRAVRLELVALPGVAVTQSLRQAQRSRMTVPRALQQDLCLDRVNPSGGSHGIPHMETPRRTGRPWKQRRSGVSRPTSWKASRFQWSGLCTEVSEVRQWVSLTERRETLRTSFRDRDVARAPPRESDPHDRQEVAESAQRRCGRSRQTPVLRVPAATALAAHQVEGSEAPVPRT